MTIYLDNNATTRPLEDVIRAVDEALRDFWHNPSSIHRPGQEARRRVELARVAVARLINAKPTEITFTSGGTESIDLAIRGVLAARGRSGAGGPPVVVTTAIEHAAVRDLLKAMSERGECIVREAALLAGGVVDVVALAQLLDEIESRSNALESGPRLPKGAARTALVTIQWANNETGVIQPIEAIGAACRERGVLFHCDGVQWVGREPTDVSNAPFDLLSISAHKLHGPKGVGALWTRRGVRLAPVLHGTHEGGRRGGTENVAGIVGFGVSADRATEWLGDGQEREWLGALRDRFERELLARVPDAVVNGVGGSDEAIPARRERSDDGPGGGDLAFKPSSLQAFKPSAARLWNTTNIAFPRLEAEALLILLSERGVCASAGAACSSGSLEPSPVLLAMGIPPELAHGSLRFSLSRETTEEEIARSVEIIADCVTRLRSSMTPGAPAAPAR